MSRGTVLSLCDRTGNMLRPWREAGYRCIAVDLQHEGRCDRDGITFVQGDVLELGDRLLGHVLDLSAVFAWPPCTDVAVSGAKHFQRKGLDRLIGSLRVLNACRKICEASGAPWMLENPVSVFSSYWRKPDHIFNPWQYTAFEPADHYTKKTCLWTGGGFVMPPAAVDPALEGVKPDDRIHKAPPTADRGDVRSVTPMGFARAVFAANGRPAARAAA